MTKSEVKKYARADGEVGAGGGENGWETCKRDRRMSEKEREEREPPHPKSTHQ